MPPNSPPPPLGESVDDLLADYVDESLVYLSQYTIQS